MATLSVQFNVYHVDGDFLQDQDLPYVIHTAKQLRKAEMIATLSRHCILDGEPGYVYSGLILPVSFGNDGITDLGYYNVDTEEQYTSSLRVCGEQNVVPTFGIVFRRHLEKA